MKKWQWFFSFLLVAFVFCAIPEWTHTNEGASNSIGSKRTGSLENAYLIPYWGKNFSYFSPLSYFVFNNGYTNSKTYKTVLDAYKSCEKTCPSVHFGIMECSDKQGGKMLIHRTHQNGLSVDFMVPKLQNGKQTRLWDFLGYWHYLLDFEEDGRLKLQHSVEIDFESMGKHILALDDAARKNGLKISMVILKIELKDDFFNTNSGREVQQRGIYFARSLENFINRVHDDHYHVDFQEI